MNARSCSDRWVRFILRDTNSTGTSSIRPEAAAFNSRPIHGNASAIGMSHRTRKPTIFPGESPRSGTGAHPLLGGHFTSPHLAGTHFWETTLDKKSLPYLDEHRIHGVAMLPASAYVEMAFAAAVEVFGTQPVELTDIEFRKALFLPDGGTATIQVVLSQATDRIATFHIYSSATGGAASGKSWMLHATGKVGLQQDDGKISWDAGHDTIAESGYASRKRDFRPGLLPEPPRKRHRLRCVVSGHRPLVVGQGRRHGRGTGARWVRR